MKFIQLFLLLIILPIFYLFNFIYYNLYSFEKSTLLLNLVYCTILMALIFIRTLKNKIINLFILFAFSYIIPLYYYFFANKIITSYNHSNSINYLSKYLVIYNLFFTIISFFLIKSNSTELVIKKKSNFIVFYINIFICLVIAFYSKSGESIFTSGGYGKNQIDNLGGFAIGEYFLIFFFIAYKFSGNNKTNTYVLITVAFLYIIESLAFGLRNELIQLSILIFILYYREKGKSRLYLFLILAGLYFSSLFSMLRSNPAIFLQNSVVENLSISNYFSNNSDLYISHQGDVIHSSSRLINFRDNHITDNSIIFTSSLYFFSSIIIPQKFLPPQANMAAFKQDEYPVGGGGNIFAYFYYWFSYIGVILIASFVGYILMSYKKYINSNFSAYFILALSTFPRWFSYSPINLFKMCVYGTIVYFFFLLFDTEIRKLVKTKINYEYR